MSLTSLPLFGKELKVIIRKYGETFIYQGVSYFVGQQIRATDQSEYEGLRGQILEIRDGDDRDTENDTPDIYCEFYLPESEQEIQTLEHRFSTLYCEKKNIEDIGLDMVIMAPEMICAIVDPTVSILEEQEGHI